MNVVKILRKFQIEKCNYNRNGPKVFGNLKDLENLFLLDFNNAIQYYCISIETE